MRSVSVAVAACGLLLFLVAAAAAQPEPAPPSQITGVSPEVKCERYRKVYDEAIRRIDAKRLGTDFIARHDAFIASGCQSPPDVCPRSAGELDFANVMVMAGMNAGMSGTFMPFACPNSGARLP